MAPPLLTLQDIHLTFGGTPLLEGAELSIGAYERLCLVGRNGSGKSTLLKIAAGEIEMDQGERFIQPGITLGSLPQEPDLTAFSTVLEYVNAGLGPSDDPYQAQYLLEQLGLTGQESTVHISGGEARRAALARVIAPEPDILFLDEPTNHLDLPAIEWLEDKLQTMRSALVIISHDRRFLEKLSKATIWIDRGRARRMEQGFAHFESWRDEIFAREELEKHKLDRKIAREEHWLTYGVTARRKRNQKRLQGLHDLRRQRREARGQIGSVKLDMTKADQSGKLVIEAKHISKSYSAANEEDKPNNILIKDFSTRIQRGDRIGIIGPNGAGKTTLLRVLTGQLEPDEGDVRLGVGLNMITLDQKRESLDPDLSLKDALTGGGSDMVDVAGEQRHVMRYMQDFLFLPEQARTPISVLSGGERGRLMLARALALSSNFLILDEPTNDLDLETLDLLQEMLGDYNGTVLLVSHDRDFLDRVASSVIASEGEGRWVEYAGGYSDMLAQRGASRVEEDKEGKNKPLAQKPEQTKAQAANGPSKPARKLSYKEKYALENLPKTMAQLEEKIAACERILADPELYNKAPEDFTRASKELGEAQTALAQAEEQWLELEILREDLG